MTNQEKKRNKKLSVLKFESQWAGKQLNLKLDTKSILEYWVGDGEDWKKNVVELEQNYQSAEFYVSKSKGCSSGGNLQEYRKFVIAGFLIRTYKVCGFKVGPNTTFKSIPNPSIGVENEHCIKIRELSSSGDVAYFRRDVRIGHVEVKECEPDVNLESRLYRLYKDRAEACKRINEGVQGVGSIPLHEVVGAVVNWEFLSRSPGDSITIHIKKKDETDHGSRGLVYNYYRITSVVLTFEKRVKEEFYPTLPPCKEVWANDSTAGVKESNVLECLRCWPSVLQKTLTTSDPSNVTRFITRFNQACDAYYFSAHVLVPSDAKHIHGEMFKRIYVYKAIHHLMVDIFHILLVDFEISSSSRSGWPLRAS